MKKLEVVVFSGKTMKRKKGFFSISAVAEMFDIHQQTIRLYEREGLIAPKRSDGNTRLFSEEDVNKLEEVIYLTHKLGINLAGVQMVLRLQKQIKKLQKDMNSAFEATHQDLIKEQIIRKNDVRDAAQQLAKLKTKAHNSAQQDAPLEPTIVDDKWEVEYDD